MADAALWIDGAPVDLSAHARLSKLVQPDVPLPARRGTEVDVVVRCDVPVSHYEGGGWGTTGLNGTPSLCVPAEEECVLEAGWEQGFLSVRTTTRSYRVACPLMGVPS